METFKSKIEFIQNLFYGLPVHSGLNNKKLLAKCEEF